MKLFRNMFILNAALILAGCQTTSQNFSLLKNENDQRGIIYIFNSCNENSNSWIGGNVPTGPTLYVNGVDIGVLGVNTYVPLKLNNGVHAIKVTKNWNYTFIPKLEYEITIKQNETKFLEYRLTSIAYSQYIHARSVFRETLDNKEMTDIEHCELNTELLAAINKKLTNQASGTP